MKSQESEWLEEQALLDEQNKAILEEIELEKRYREEMEWDIKDAFEDFWKDTL